MVTDSLPTFLYFEYYLFAKKETKHKNNIKDEFEWFFVIDFYFL